MFHVLDTFYAEHADQRASGRQLGFLYVDLKDLIPAIAGLGGNVLSPDVDANVRPLRSLLVYGTADGSTTVGTLFLEIE